ncbi:hypothetical protein D3C72_1759630 [compost metagenome]
MRNSAQPESRIITPIQKGTVIRCGTGQPIKIISESKISPLPASATGFQRLCWITVEEAMRTAPSSSSALPNTSVATMLSSAGTSHTKKARNKKPNPFSNTGRLADEPITSAAEIATNPSSASSTASASNASTERPS